MKVTGITTNSALQPSTATDWYDSQTLGLDNATVYWKSIAPKPQTSAYANARSSRFDEMHVVVVDDSGKDQELLDRS